jgi:peptide/nickel transport system substrate-binding protein
MAGPPFAATIAAAPSRLARQPQSEPLTVIVTENRFDFDPHSSGSEASLFFFGVYELMFQLKGDRTDEFAPMLADSWEVNADQSSYTFHLSPHAVFHDGSPCDAAAVKASFTRFLRLAGPPVYIVSRFVQDPDQLVVVDEHTIRFDLGRPQPLFLSAIASAYGAFVVNPRVVDAHKTADDPWAHEWLTQNTEGAGSGPYRITENAPGERTVLTRFDAYHRGWGGDHFDEIVVRVVEDEPARRLLLERGEADAVTGSLTAEDIAALAGMPSLQIVTYDTTNVAWIAMNAHRLRTAEVRKGFSYAFPYDDVVNGVFRGTLRRTGPLATGIRGSDPNIFLYPTDLAQAKALILSAGFAEGDSFDFMFPTEWLESATVAQLFQANVQAMGFALELVPIDHTTQIDIIYGDLPAEERPDFFISGWWPDYDDPWVQLAPNFLRPTSEGGDGVANVGLWSNDRFEQLMTEAKTYTDEARLRELMREAQNILTEQDPPCIYLGQLRYTTVLASDVRGFVGNPLYLNQYPFYEMSRATG